jgi:tRNA acetyltransferase TAN1
MNTFNLIVSSNRTYEHFAEREIWFILFIIGDHSPVIMHSPVPGILLVNTKLDPFKVIRKMREIIHKEPNFFQYILRVIPIDHVVETDLELIHLSSLELYRSKKRLVRKRKTFAIQIKKRATDVSRNEIIDKIVHDISNSVNLKDPDWIFHYEIIGNVTGISLMKPNEILRTTSEKNLVLHPNSKL